MVLLFTRRFKAPPLFAAAYGAFKDSNVTFALVRDSEVIEMFEKPPIPSIWFYKDGEGVQYKGKQEYTDLIDAIAEHYKIDLDGTNEEL